MCELIFICMKMVQISQYIHYTQHPTLPITYFCLNDIRFSMVVFVMVMGNFLSFFFYPYFVSSLSSHIIWTFAYSIELIFSFIFIGSSIFYCATISYASFHPVEFSSFFHLLMRLRGFSFWARWVSYWKLYIEFVLGL